MCCTVQWGTSWSQRDQLTGRRRMWLQSCLKQKYRTGHVTLSISYCSLKTHTHTAGGGGGLLYWGRDLPLAWSKTTLLYINVVTRDVAASSSAGSRYSNIICGHKLLPVRVKRETGPEVGAVLYVVYCRDILGGFKLVTCLKNSTQLFPTSLAALKMKTSHSTRGIHWQQTGI